MFRVIEEMRPRNEDEMKLRALVLAKTLLSEAQKYLREIDARIACDEFPKSEATRAATDLSSRDIQAILKQFVCAFLLLISREQAGVKVSWFENFIAVTMVELDKLAQLEEPAKDIFEILKEENEIDFAQRISLGYMSIVQVSNTALQQALAEQICYFVQHSAELRSKLLAYALTQDATILNDYVFTMLLFETKQAHSD